MNAAIYYDSKYGSTEDYARWISEASGLPLRKITGEQMTPGEHDFYVTVAPIYYYKPLNLGWLTRRTWAFSTGSC